VASPAPWRRWGPYLAERQWGTVREDYSADGDCWNSFPHDHARSRAYRWGEDGLLGISDDQGLLCFALALWNTRDPILKERLFGLNGPEGNHGEDVKEHYFYLDATPTHSYLKALYKYPQAEYPYAQLVHENRRRSRLEPELELADTGALDASRYFDVQAEYSKAAAHDILIRITITNHGPQAAPIHVLPTLWFRNTWSWRAANATTPRLSAQASGMVRAEHPRLGTYQLAIDPIAGAAPPTLLFTDNNTNTQRLFNSPSSSPHVKDSFHDRVIHNAAAAVNPDQTGTKAAAWFNLSIPAGESRTVRLRLTRVATPRDTPATSAPTRTAPSGTTPSQPFAEFNAIFASRIAEADEFYAALGLASMDPQHALIARQAYAGLIWSKQFYHYWIPEWLAGDPAQPKPPAARLIGRNADWTHLNNADVISMPDKWEYPWYAAWDLAFHMIRMARLDPAFAKDQLLLLLRKWYMHPSGAMPAYEFAFGDVNPPVHAWACWRVYKMSAPRGQRDRDFLKRAFMKLLINFTWWVNRKDPDGKNVFGGGFLGLDNIGVFDRSRPLPTGGTLQQADGTAWMAFYCGTMLSIALELAHEDPSYEDIATKFFEHFISIIDAINTIGGTGLWDERDGFYYDPLQCDGAAQPLRVRSLVGIIPIIACEILEDATLDRLPDFKRRLEWFCKNRPDAARHVNSSRGGTGVGPGKADHASPHPGHRLLAVPDADRLRATLRYLLDESEFLSPHGIRSLSKFHQASPFILRAQGHEYRVDYTPGESTTAMFGGNSNWRGPIWFPLNFLVLEALERYHHFYGDTLTVEHPNGSGRLLTLDQVANEIRRRLASLFIPDVDGIRPAHRPADGANPWLTTDPASGDLVLFHEHFHADTGRGLGATHQTSWTALIATILGDIDKARSAPDR